MATGYEKFSVTKTLVLPIPESEMTINEYKEAYGIDLMDVIYLDVDAGTILFKDGVFMVILKKNYGGRIPCAFVPNDAIYRDYESGVQDASLAYIFADRDEVEGNGIVFTIDKASDLTIDNLKVKAAQY